MATIMAHTLLGQTHPYDGGVTNVTHQLWLTENSVARGISTLMLITQIKCMGTHFPN